jgi:Sulfotransferase domain
MSERTLSQRAALRVANVRWKLARQARRRLPRPVWQEGIRTGNGVRRAIGRGRGRGRMQPDFVILGAAKAGTTSLYGWLSEHPFVSPASTKEVHYFDYNFFRGDDWYRSHFPRRTDRDAFAAEHGRPFLTGEASPPYLSHPWVPQRLKRVIPDAKLLVALRNPVDRAYSQYQMSVREEEEEFDFEHALEIEDERLDPERAKLAADGRYSSWAIGCWSYKMRSRYAEQVECWLELFPREQFHFLTLEDLSVRPQETLDAVHEFLGLPPHAYADLKPLHTAPRYDSLAPGTREQLGDYFRPYNERLYELIGRDLGWGSAAGGGRDAHDAAGTAA